MKWLILIPHPNAPEEGEEALHAWNGLMSPIACRMELLKIVQLGTCSFRKDRMKLLQHA